MCLKPLYIYNPTTDFIPTDAVRLDVPCNECEECRQQRKNEYYSRILYTLASRPSDKYINGFLTLTFNNDNLPVWHTHDYAGECIDFVCFDNKLASTFMRRISQYANMYYGITDVQYIICPEYGSQSTKRPHLHCIISIPRFGNRVYSTVRADGSVVSIPYELTIDKLYEWFNTFWTYGFICPKNPEGSYTLDFDEDGQPVYRAGSLANGKKISPFEISDNGKAARYTSKYTLKELDFFDKPEAKQLTNTFKEFGRRLKSNSLSDAEEVYLRDWCKSYRRHFPRVLTSHGFGESILDTLKQSENPLATLETGLRDPYNDDINVRIPKLYVRKLLSDARTFKVGNKRLVRWYPNELGIKYKVLGLDKRVKRMTDEFNQFFDDSAVNEYVNVNNIKDLFLETKRRFSNDCRALAIYTCVYRNRVYNINAYRAILSVETTCVPQISPDVDLATLDDVHREFFMSYLKYNKYYNDKSNSKIFKREDLFNTLNCYSGFETCVQLYFEYKRWFKQCDYERRRKEYEVVDKVSSKYRNGKSILFDTNHLHNCVAEEKAIERIMFGDVDIVDHLNRIEEWEYYQKTNSPFYDNDLDCYDYASYKVIENEKKNDADVPTRSYTKCGKSAPF